MRTLKSHIMTVEYFVQLGWKVTYDIFDQAENGKPDEGFTYTLYISRPNAEDWEHAESCDSITEVMTRASEYLTEIVQNAGRWEG